jgi:hypothetical protein
MEERGQPGTGQKCGRSDECTVVWELVSVVRDRIGQFARLGKRILLQEVLRVERQCPTAWVVAFVESWCNALGWLG